MGSSQDYNGRGPYMQFPEEDHLSYVPSWSSSYGVQSHYPNRSLNVYGTEIPMENMQNHGMEPMERFFFEQSSIPGLLGMSSPQVYQGVNSGYSAQPPFPAATEFRRAPSPGATSSSRSQSLSPHEEVKPMHHIHPHTYGTPDSGYSNYPYPDQPEYYTRETYSTSNVFGGGSSGIALQDIQGVPDQPIEEPSREELKFEIVEFYPVKTEVEYTSCGDEDAHGEPVTDVDSAHYTQDEGSDTEYKPNSKSAANKPRRKRTLSQTSHGSSARGRITKRSNAASRNTHTAPQGGRAKRARRGEPTSIVTIAKSTGDMGRPFPCPFAIYGCTSTFSSKNEWKRHVGTQHVRLGYWRCDLCPPSHDHAQTAIYYNDFNRKDLFTQHLRRMHSSTPAETKNNTTTPSAHNGAPLPLVNENTVPEHQRRCYEALRTPPPSSACLFCNANFSGTGSWDERMEHVGRHLEKENKGLIDPANWREDLALQRWFEKEGLIERIGDKGWKLGDGVPKDESSDDTTDDDDADAECEDDED